MHSGSPSVGDSLEGDDNGVCNQALLAGLMRKDVYGGDVLFVLGVEVNDVIDSALEGNP